MVPSTKKFQEDQQQTENPQIEIHLIDILTSKNVPALFLSQFK